MADSVVKTLFLLVAADDAGVGGTGDDLARPLTRLEAAPSSHVVPRQSLSAPFTIQLAKRSISSAGRAGSPFGISAPHDTVGSSF